MKLDDFVTQKNAESGVWFPLEIRNKPVGISILIYGDDAPAVSNSILDRSLAASKREKEGEKVDYKAVGLESVLDRIGGIKSDDKTPITLDGKEVANDRNGWRQLLAAIPDIQNFVLEKARNRANFLSNAKDNSKGPSANIFS